jgi:hypothetical protein
LRDSPATGKQRRGRNSNGNDDFHVHLTSPVSRGENYRHAGHRIAQMSHMFFSNDIFCVRLCPAPVQQYLETLRSRSTSTPVCFSTKSVQSVLGSTGVDRVRAQLRYMS